jgi:hypothetical protein
MRRLPVARFEMLAFSFLAALTGILTVATVTPIA